jgi:hypothetical protein
MNKLRKQIENEYLLPGSMVRTDVSISTRRRWEKKGWIRDAGTYEAPRLFWIVLTRKGYMEA